MTLRDRLSNVLNVAAGTLLVGILALLHGRKETRDSLPSAPSTGWGVLIVLVGTGYLALQRAGSRLKQVLTLENTE